MADNLHNVPMPDLTVPPDNALLAQAQANANPQHFNGDPRNFETFITSIDIVFMANPYIYVTHTTKIYYILSYMTKIAAQWAQHMVHSINIGSYIITIWEDFRKHLKNTFENADRRNQAQQKLLALRQGALTAKEFFIQFDKYYLESGFNEVAAIHYVKQAV
jgi:hypothetical protein